MLKRIRLYYTWNQPTVRQSIYERDRYSPSIFLSIPTPTFSFLAILSLPRDPSERMMYGIGSTQSVLCRVSSSVIRMDAYIYSSLYWLYIYILEIFLYATYSIYSHYLLDSFKLHVTFLRFMLLVYSHIPSFVPSSMTFCTFLFCYIYTYSVLHLSVFLALFLIFPLFSLFSLRRDVVVCHLNIASPKIDLLEWLKDVKPSRHTTLTRAFPLYIKSLWISSFSLSSNFIFCPLYAYTVYIYIYCIFFSLLSFPKKTSHYLSSTQNLIQHNTVQPICITFFKNMYVYCVTLHTLYKRDEKKEGHNDDAAVTHDETVWDTFPLPLFSSLSLSLPYLSSFFSLYICAHLFLFFIHIFFYTSRPSTCSLFLAGSA